jgi:hypothetical protein
MPAFPGSKSCHFSVILNCAVPIISRRRNMHLLFYHLSSPMRDVKPVLYAALRGICATHFLLRNFAEFRSNCKT